MTGGIFGRGPNRLEYRFDAERLWIEGWGENGLRVRAAKTASMPQEPWALLDPAPSEPRIDIGPGGASITNGKIQARIAPNGKVSFYNRRGELLLEEYLRNRRDLSSPDCSALEIEAREFRPIPGGDYEIKLRFKSSGPGERIYGMGQYQQPFLNLKGMDLELAQRNSQASVPFALSSRGYGFLWNNPAVGRVVFGHNLSTWEARSSKSIDYWICAGDSPAEIEETYAGAVGTVPLMPDYALGFWQCKLRYRTQEELLEVARSYKKRGLPLSVIVVDFFHWPFQGDWKFDPRYWPDPGAMIAELKGMGVELMVSVWPTVDRRSENYREMLERGLLIRAERGLRAVWGGPGNAIHFDATNPEARAYVWEKVKKNYYDRGIQIFWLDEAEPEYSVYDFDNYRYHRGTALEIGNAYPLMYARAFFEGMREAGQERVVNLIRCAWAGSQRYGALVWSGDIHSSFESLRSQITAGLNMGLAGIPWWTTDIGGFHGGLVSDPRFHELFVRWFQYGAFCPVMRLHGDREPHEAIPENPEGVPLSGAANEVWSYSPEVYEICKKYLFLRERLRPYIARQMEAAHRRGTPVMRPLFYDFPQDPAAWEIEDQYLFGPDYLVAPVLFEGQRERELYLPAGAEWTDSLTGEVFPGGRRLTAQAPLDHLPVFTRNGAALG
jgi:alpha-D-xyloside xylohydrolase